MRIGCLVVPALPLQAWLRAAPELAGAPLVVVEGEGVRTRVVNASDAAMGGGIAAGQLLSEAQVLVPTVALRHRSPVLEEASRASVVDAAARISPRVEESEPGVVLVDTSGLRSIWGEERAIANALLAAAHRVGFVGRAGVATGKRLARLAADQADGLLVVTDEQAPAFRAKLPLGALTDDRELLLTLERWGLRRAGEFAALPSDGVGTRLGDAGLELHRRALGVDDEPLFPLPEPEQYAEVVQLDYAVELVEPLLFLLRPALDRLVARLDCRGKVIGALTLRFALDPKGEHPLQVGLAAPTREVDDLLALCRQQIEAHPPQAGICGMTLLATPAEVRRQQLGLWDLPTVAPARILGAVAQVAGLCGAENVGRMVVPDRHRPDAARPQRFEPPPPPSTLDAPKPAPRPHLALRRFRPPAALTVAVSKAGQLERVRARGVNGRVATLAGPWRLDAEWYLAAVVQDTYDVSLEDGRCYLVGRDRLTQQWWLFGQYD